MSTSINIIPNNNLVSVQDSSNQLTITNNNSNVTVDITQPVTNIVQVLTGPQGQKGDQGPIGPSGSAGVVDTGSFVTTASFNSFTSSYLADSSSFNSRIGSLTAATSSYVLNSQTSSMTVLSASFARTASFLPVGTYAITSSWAVSASRALTASFLPPGFYNISVATANFAPTIPGGTDTQIQFNNSNTLDGSGYLTYDYTNRNLKQGFGNSAGANTFRFSQDKIINGQFSVSGDLTGEFLVGNFLYISDKDYSNQFGEIVSRIVDVQLNGSDTGITLEVNLNAIDTTGYILANLSLWPGDWTGDQETIPLYSHAQGQSSYVLGNYSHAEGEKTTAFGLSSHAEGTNTRAIGNYSHAEGLGSQAIGSGSHTEGENTQAIGDYSHVEGYQTKTGIQTAYEVTSVGFYSLTLSPEYGDIISLFQPNDKLLVLESDFIGVKGTVLTVSSTGFFGSTVITTLEQVPTFLGTTTVIPLTTDAQNWNGNKTIAGINSHAEGSDTHTVGDYSHAEGYYTLAAENYSHAEGEQTRAAGLASHAEGKSTLAAGRHSHAEGSGSQAIGDLSHAEGLGTITSGSYQHAQGQFNLSSSAQSAFIIGNGTSNSTRSNLVFASGSEFQISGSLRVRDNVTVNTNTFAIDSVNNRVGIGKTNPSTALDVNGNTIVTGSFTVVTGSAIELRVTNTGVVIGSALTDIHPITGSVRVTGSLILTGSMQNNVAALTITSNTASLDLNRSNFFTLQLVAGVNTHINPSNIKPGQTAILQVSTTGSGTVSFPSSVKQPSGSSYTPTTTTGIDILTLASFDASTLYVVNTKNLI